MPTVTVESQPGHAFTTTVTAGEHSLVADEPLGAGGDDLGPTPYELLLAALGTCTAMTLLSYARHKAWPLERVTIRLAHDRVHAADCRDCETAPVRVDRISRQIGLVGPLDDEQRARLVEIAARCPVHRTLTGEIRIVDSIVDPAMIV